MQVYFPFLRAKLNPKLTRYPLMHQDIAQGHKLGFMDLILSPNFLYFTDHAGLLRNKNEKGLYKPAENRSLFAALVAGQSLDTSAAGGLFCF